MCNFAIGKSSAKTIVAKNTKYSFITYANSSTTNYKSHNMDMNMEEEIISKKLENIAPISSTITNTTNDSGISINITSNDNTEEIDVFSRFREAQAASTDSMMEMFKTRFIYTIYILKYIILYII